MSASPSVIQIASVTFTLLSTSNKANKQRNGKIIGYKSSTTNVKKLPSCHIISFTHLLSSMRMSIFSPHEIVTPGAGDTLGTVDRFCAGVGLGTKDELGAKDTLGTGDVLLRVDGLDAVDEASSTRGLPDNQTVAFRTLNSCENVLTYGYFWETVFKSSCWK